MTTHSTQRPTIDVRADGPAVVRKGPIHGPAVVVIDPYGESKHDELPATWRPLANDVAVVWWRLPAAVRVGMDGDALPAELTEGRAPVYLVSCGDAALLAVSLAAERPDVVRTVIVVDPPWQDEDLSSVRDIASSVSVHHVVTNTPGRDAEGLPLGHPDVVRAVLGTLLSAVLWRGDASPSRARDVWQQARARLDGLLDTLLGGR
jgi:pimeloyl-ACP methyl ester carboxylesterase